MKIDIQISKPHTFKSDLIVIGMFEKESAEKYLDDALDKEISHLIKNEEFKGETGQIQIITTLSKIPAKKILLIGLGKKKEFTLEKLKNAVFYCFVVEINLHKKKI